MFKHRNYLDFVAVQIDRQNNNLKVCSSATAKWSHFPTYSYKMRGHSRLFVNNVNPYS